MSALLQRLARSGASQAVALGDALAAVQAELRPAGAAAWRLQRRHAASAAGGSEEQPPADSAPAAAQQAPQAAAAEAAGAPKQAAKPAAPKPAGKQGKQPPAGAKPKQAAAAQQPAGKAKAATPAAAAAPPSRLSGKQVGARGVHCHVCVGGCAAGCAGGDSERLLETCAVIGNMCAIIETCGALSHNQQSHSLALFQVMRFTAPAADVWPPLNKCRRCTI